jgi:hypothetical protein
VPASKSQPERSATRQSSGIGNARTTAPPCYRVAPVTAISFLLPAVLLMETLYLISNRPRVVGAPMEACRIEF